jgi:hypothetical protein
MFNGQTFIISKELFTVWSWAHISGRQSPCLTRGSPPPPIYMTNAGGELRVKPGVWRPEMWALANNKNVVMITSCPVTTTICRTVFPKVSWSSGSAPLRGGWISIISTLSFLFRVIKLTILGETTCRQSCSQNRSVPLTFLCEPIFFLCEPMGRREISHTFSLLVEIEGYFTHEFINYVYYDWGLVSVKQLYCYYVNYFTMYCTIFHASIVHTLLNIFTAE